MEWWHYFWQVLIFIYGTSLTSAMCHDLAKWLKSLFTFFSFFFFSGLTTQEWSMRKYHMTKCHRVTVRWHHMTKSLGNCGKIVHRLCSSCISSIGNLTGTPLSSPCHLRLEVVLRCLSLSPYRYDYRFTCTCIGFFYVKYTEPIY